MRPMLGERSLRSIGRGIMRPANYRAMLSVAKVSPEPATFARRYLVNDRSDYPARCPLRTPAGVVRPTVYSHWDIVTANEIFCRGDYLLPPDCRVVVDLGANIGISAIYFLTRDPGVCVHAFEPDPRNVERLYANLAPFAGRWTIYDHAVGDQDATLAFGRDGWSGRHGAIGFEHGEQIQVWCRHVNDVLRDVLAVEGRMDFLKIDIEGLEHATVAAIDSSLVRELKGICFETEEPLNPWPDWFSMASTPNICRLTRR